MQRIAAIGYQELESASNRKGGYYGLKAKEFAAKVKQFGLTWKAHHATGGPRRPANAAPPTGAEGKPQMMPPTKNLRDNYQEIVNEVLE